MEKTIVLLATLDTKGIELGYFRERIIEQGHKVIVVDVGILGTPLLKPDITREEVAQAAGTKLEEIVSLGKRAEAMRLMTEGAVKIVHRLYQSGRLDGIASLGGTTGTALACAVMRSLPIGIPKVMVSTVASADTRPYLDTKDIVMIPSVTDILGLNRITKRILATAAGAIAGMVGSDPGPIPSDKPIIGVTIHGNLMPCVYSAKAILEAKGYEVIGFPAAGIGGKTLEEWIEQGLIDGVFDLVTRELVDNIFGGLCDAGPSRLEAAGRKGIPQLVAPGDADSISLNMTQEIPQRWKGRRLYWHNLVFGGVQANKDEMILVAKVMAEKLNKAIGPTAVIIPRRGFSYYGEDWRRDPAADSAFVEVLKSSLKPEVAVVEVDARVNDELFAQKAAILLDELMRRAG